MTSVWKLSLHTKLIKTLERGIGNGNEFHLQCNVFRANLLVFGPNKSQFQCSLIVECQHQGLADDL